LIAAITIEASRQATRITIATVQEVGTARTLDGREIGDVDPTIGD